MAHRPQPLPAQPHSQPWIPPSLPTTFIWTIFIEIPVNLATVESLTYPPLSPAIVCFNALMAYQDEVTQADKEHAILQDSLGN